MKKYEKMEITVSEIAEDVVRTSAIGGDTTKQLSGSYDLTNIDANDIFNN